LEKKEMLKRILALIFIIALFFPVGAQAQGTITLPAAEVDLWPEYDRPSVLVIYHLTLPTDASLPYQISVRIPASVGEPSAVASRQPDGSLYNLPYDPPQVSGDWAVISFRATTPEVQIEYYDTSLTKQGDARHFEYTWNGEYAVDSLVIQIQQPKGANEMRISPSLGSGRVASDGLTYYTADLGPVPADQPFSISLDYQKTSDELSATSIQVKASGPINETTTNLTSLLPWLLAGLGILLIGFGLWWYWQSGRGQSFRPQRRSRRRTIAPTPPDEGASMEDGGHIYCHQCGKRAAPGDRFCRTCGTPLRLG
jgi:hypothetical protein